jgi:signal transduction histidine kinase
VDITERKRLKDEMEYYIREITRIQEEERKRISRELHDDTAQALSYLVLELDALATRPEVASQDILTRLERLKKLTLNALQEVRRFSHELRPGVLDQLGLVAALELIIEEFNARNQIQIEFHVEGKERRLSGEEEQSLFRIAQEALNNIYKHSQAIHALVKLRFDSQFVSLEIHDDGKGFSTSDMDLAISKGRLGLLGMRERAKLINAQLKIISTPNCGTTVRVELPA